MNFKKIFCLALCAAALSVTLADTASAQRRERVVSTVSSQPTNQPPATTPSSTRPTSSSRPVKPMSQNIIVVGSGQVQNQTPQLVKKTVSDRPVTSAPSTAPVNRSPLYTSSINRDLMSGITSRLGIPYLYGSTGPNRYDCSGFVWRVFQDAGIHFTRASARSLYSTFEPVYGEDRFKFGTLVFLNGLGHMGIVADENGFYHASSSKGITYSPFKGYWANRIVGFRRVPVEGAP